ncbi:MAG: 2-amino-4-hydroxy-6-hydroxymethyldihydropteridine diphosphokinase [Porphyromonas sp.]|nr:2-amino-4-hydroxy-6-hydroxymethyldihydropteridine diphosphokinase [Porphyromonas sp.]
MEHLVYLALGSNEGDRHIYMQEAINSLEDGVGCVEAVSQWIETEPVGFVSSFRFLNAAVRLRTYLEPLVLLDVLQEIERRLGRTRKSHDGQHYDRTIDIDILLYDELRMEHPRLQIPHPRMWWRDFVLHPLREVYLGDWNALVQHYTG